MSEHIIDTTQLLDASVFQFSEPKLHKSGGKVVNVFNKKTKESAQAMLPLLLTWGAQQGLDNDKQPNGKYTMALQFPSTDFTTPEAEASLRWFQDFQTLVKNTALTNSMKWFGKEIRSMEVIEEKFNIMLRYPKKEKGSEIVDLTKPPTLTTKVPQWNGVWKTEIYDEDGNPLFVYGKVNPSGSPLQFLIPKSHVITLIECGGLWFVNGKISITWNLRQAIVQKPKERIEGLCMLKPKASDKQRLKDLPPPEDETDPDGAVSTTVVDDSDDEFDTNVVNEAYKVISQPVIPEPVPEPEPVQEQVVEDSKPKKKIVKKTK
jgi:hypothetical protein